MTDPNVRSEVHPNGLDLPVAVIGAGNMGRAITRRLTTAGYTVLLANRDIEKAKRVADEISRLGAGPVKAVSSQEAAAHARIVVLAIPYRESTGLAVELSDLLRGKIVVDISNPLNASYDDLITDPTTSAAEEIQRRLTGAAVVKAFNTNFAGPLFEGNLEGEPLDVFLASDDAEAKAEVATLVRKSGLRALDAGALANARTLERIQVMFIGIQFKHNLQFQSGLKFLPQDFEPSGLHVPSPQPRRVDVRSGSIEEQIEALRAMVFAVDARVESLASALGRAAEALIDQLEPSSGSAGRAGQDELRKTH